MTSSGVASVTSDLSRNRAIYLASSIVRDERNKCTVYMLNGMIHRDGDEPAIEWDDGSKEWWKYNKIYRDDYEPTFVCAQAKRKWWFKDGVYWGL